MEKRITLRDIADQLGLHYSSVSMALRNHPRIPAATRRKVQETARKMNYRPDAMVQALAAYRTLIRPSSNEDTLAWLMKSPTPSSEDDYPFNRFLAGASRRAEELGYRLELFSLVQSGMTTRRMETILRTRGIRGIIVAPQPPPKALGRIVMNWSLFSAVTIGYSLVWPPLPAVSNHQFLTSQLACRRLRSLGYERIGLCIDRMGDERVHGAFVGGYLSDRAHRKNTPYIEPFLFNDWNPRGFKKWLDRFQPQAVIFHDSDLAELAIRQLHLKVPQDIGIVCLTKTDRGYAYIDQNQEQVGAAAVDLLVSLIYRQQRGVPPFAQRLLIEGSWKSGYSVRRLTAAPLPRFAESTRKRLPHLS